MKKKIVCIIQARTGSTRFPGKVLKKMQGKTVLSHVIKKALYSSFINRENVIVATTTKKHDDVIANISRQEGVRCFRGSEDDVLDRYYKAAKKHKGDIVLRVTSDCPLIDHKIINRVIKEFTSDKKTDYCSNRLILSYPEGLDTEVFSFNALERAWKEADRPYDREHVTPYIYRQNGFNVKNALFGRDLSFLHFSVDYKQDLEFVKRVYKYLYEKKQDFVLEDIIGLLINKPELLKINQASGSYSKFLKYVATFNK